MKKEPLDDIKKTKIDQPNHVLTLFHSGKWSKRQKNIRSYAQKGPSCILYSARKFAFFTEEYSAIKESKYYQAYKVLKKMFAQEGIQDNVSAQLKAAEEACNLLSIDSVVCIKQSLKFIDCVVGLEKSKIDKYYHEEMSLEVKFEILYLELQRHIFPKFGLMPGAWQPENGVEALKETLRTYGPVLVAGKYGRAFYSGQPSELEDLSSKERKVYAFPKKNCEYIGDKVLNNHAVIVDEVRKMTVGDSDVDMVSFRDPNHNSIPSSFEYVYIQSYKTFAARIKIWDDEHKSGPVYVYHQSNSMVTLTK